jgi:hypothetical protein
MNLAMTELRAAESGRKPRILELGYFCLFKRVWPERVTLVWGGKGTEDVPVPPDAMASFSAFLRIGRDLATGAYDLIVCFPPALPPWREVRTRRALGRRLLYHALLRHPALFGQTPLLVLDVGDRTPIARHNHHLLRRAAWVFKRELPAAREEVLLGTSPQFQSRDAVLGSRLYATLEPKLYPTSLGLPAERWADVPERPLEKTADVFYAGKTDSEVRRRGLPELDELARGGIKVDVSPERLPRKEFYERCARAWLVWSPEGFGWDCFRHYEAAACRSVPVINRPRIAWHRPMEDGVHCFFYDPERGGLGRAIRAALADKARLRAMAEAGRAHVLANHTHEAICTYILGQTILRERHVEHRHRGPDEPL